MSILVVDDHPLIVEDIMDELAGIAPDAQVMGTSDSLEVEKLPRSSDRGSFFYAVLQAVTLFASKQ